MKIWIHIFTMFFVCAFFALCSAGEGEEFPYIVTQADTRTVEFGGRIKVELFSENDANIEVIFPERVPDAGDFSFIRSYPIKAGSVKGLGAGRGYVMGIYSTGIHVIPPIKVTYKKKGDQTLFDVYSRQVPIEVKSLLSKDDKDIREVKGLVTFPPDLWVFFLITIFFLAAVFIAGGIFWVNKKRKNDEEKARRSLPPHEVAYLELSRLRAKGLHENGHVKEFYTILSDILRHYIEGRFTYHAPEMTTQEFIEKTRESSFLGSGDKQRLKDFLTHCDMIKFAKYSATQLEMLDSFKVVEDFVDQTRIFGSGEEKE